MISDNERREVAAKIRGNAYGRPFYGTLLANVAGADPVDDEACWKRLADLIDPDNIPDNADENAHGLSGHCDREALMKLADDIECEQFDNISAPYCEPCLLKSNSEAPTCGVCIARRIREACESDSNAFAAGDKAEAATDAHADEGEAAEGYHIVDVSDKFNENIAAIDFVRDNGGLEAVKARLMPEGMEWLLEVWPKWSNGEYCKFGDRWTADKYGDYEPRQLRRLAFYTPEQLREWGQDEGDNFGYEWDFMRPSDTTYRPDKAEPPAPKVLDADGAEIRVGDTVWHVKTGRAYVFVEPSYGDTVVVRLAKYDDAEGEQYAPNQLTHERPDSWERIEEDASKNPFDYCKDVGHKLDTCENAEAYKAHDLVRRAKLQYFGRINESTA